MYLPASPISSGPSDLSLASSCSWSGGRVVYRLPERQLRRRWPPTFLSCRSWPKKTSLTWIWCAGCRLSSGIRPSTWYVCWTRILHLRRHSPPGQFRRPPADPWSVRRQNRVYSRHGDRRLCSLRNLHSRKRTRVTSHFKRETISSVVAIVIVVVVAVTI